MLENPQILNFVIYILNTDKDNQQETNILVVIFRRLMFILDPQRLYVIHPVYFIFTGWRYSPTLYESIKVVYSIYFNSDRYDK